MNKWQKYFVLILLALSFRVCAQDGDLQYRADDNEADGKDVNFKTPQRFRLGEIVDAGISRRSVNIHNPDKLLPLKMKSKIYAVVRVKLDQGRSISIHDFSLIHNYKGFNCVAISPVPGDFNAERRVFPASGANKVYDLLFVLDVPDFNAAITYRCALHYMFASTGMVDVDVKFKNFDNSAIQLSAPK